MTSPRKEVLYEGRYYDVTDFIKRHPGGEEILEYHTLPGEDATIPITQFHNRNFKKVIGILKSFKSRPATSEEEAGSLVQANDDDDPKSLRNKAMTEDYLQLFRELKEEGFFEPSYPHIAYRFVEPVLITLLGALVLTHWDHPYSILVGTGILGIGQIRCGWVMHEGGHHSLTGIPKVDRLLCCAYMGISQGISGDWWRLDHSQHHAMTNRLHHDLDLDCNPLVAFNVDVAKESSKREKAKPNWFMKHQKYFLPLDATITFFYWKVVVTPVSLLKYGNPADWASVLLHYYLSYTFMTFPVFMLSAVFASWYLFANISLNHSFLPVREEPCHWIEAALVYSCNLTQSTFTDWWMGYMNLQIEHHLFPTMPQFRLHLIRERVKALAAKHELPYRVNSYWKAVWVGLKNIVDVEDEMRKMY